IMSSESELADPILSRHVLVIDDNEDSHDLMRAFFQPKKYMVTCCKVRDLDSLAKNQHFDVILIDESAADSIGNDVSFDNFKGSPVILLADSPPHRSGGGETLFSIVKKPVRFL